MRRKDLIYLFLHEISFFEYSEKSRKRKKSPEKEKPAGGLFDFKEIHFKFDMEKLLRHVPR